MKKIISLILVCTLIFALTGCGKSEDEFNPNVTVKKKIVLNNNKIKLSIKEQSFKEGKLIFDVENKTNKNVKSGVLKSLVNNICLENTSGESSIKAKKTSTFEVVFNKDEMKKVKIGEVSSISLSIIFIDKDFNEVTNTGYFTLKTSSDYEQDLESSGDEVFNKKDVSVYLVNKEVVDNQVYWNLQIINNSKNAYFINIGDAKVNKAEFKSTFVYETIPAKSLTNKKLVIGSGELSEYHVSAKQIGTLKVTIALYDIDTYEKRAEQTEVELK